MQQKTFQGFGHPGFHTVAYTEWGSDTSQPPIMCVHGLTRNGRDFDWLAEKLQATRRVFCPDMPGRGKSDDLTDPAFYSYPQYANDMAILMAKTDSKQVDWVGTSMGGLLGMLVASLPNNSIRRLVMNDVGPYIPRANMKRIADYVSMPTSFVDLDQLERHIRTIYAPFGIKRDEDWKKLASTSARKLPDGKLTLAHDTAIAKNFSALEADVDFWDIYDKVKCPTLVIRGKDSDILSSETAQQMTQRGPKAKIVELPGVGHAPALMDADQIKLIADFLA
ncbi:MAG TPA: alpha/beta hydrolase [Alphaproteobacteria bacterium]|nr:alpha/beta hydrolase [Alphaproteobacteria bacterium]